jgi:hypothetical protein
MDETEGPPCVAIPEPLDRKLRFGPFPSTVDALRFLGYAAAGACLAPIAPLPLWLGVVGLGFVLSVSKPGGESLESRAVRLARWHLRTVRPGVAMRPTEPGGNSPRGHARLASGVRATVLRAAGLPLAYLPSGDLARRFELFRELLRTLDGSLMIHATTAPIHARPFVPAEPRPVGPERAARDGYRELVELIARGRSVRQVFVVIASPEPGVEGAGRLEASTSAVLDRLGAVGLKPVRLRDRALRDAVHRIGLRSGAGA